MSGSIQNGYICIADILKLSEIPNPAKIKISLMQRGDMYANAESE